MSAASSLTDRIWLDLQPTPGRLGASLRILLASILTLVLLLVWQIPFASIGLYFVFIVGRDNPSVSFRSGFLSMVTLVLSVATVFGVVILSGNDPLVRLLSVTVVSLVAGTLVAASTVPALPSTWGFIFCTLIALWEKHAPEDALVKNCLWILAATGVAVICSIAVEYVFGSRDTVQALMEERRSRHRALVDMFTLYAQGAEPAKLREAVARVARLAVAGQSGMQRLYNNIVDRNLDLKPLPIGTRVRITMLAQLMDVSAAFGSQNPTSNDPEVQRRCAQIALECTALLEDRTPQHEDYKAPGTESALTLLERVEGNLHIISSMPIDFSPDRDSQLVALPSSKASLLIPGAFKDPSTWAFGLKISLCATLCYIVYFAVDWPGISTSVTTVLIAGLATTGAIKQKFAFRLAGALIGGLILGIGSTVFLFPEMDSITSLVVLIAVIAFAGAWISGGRQYSYVGLQMVFSFYLVAFEDFRPPTSLAPPRDRLMGILLALLVMWFVFDQIWPVRTVTAMRKALASLLHNEANLFRTELAGLPREELIRQTDFFRDHMGKTMAAIRTMNDAVEYEFGLDRQEQIKLAEEILRGALTAVAVAWNELSVMHEEDDADFLTAPGLRQMRQDLSIKLDELAALVTLKLEEPYTLLSNPLTAEILDSPRYGEYAQQTMARFSELQLILNGVQ